MNCKFCIDQKLCIEKRHIDISSCKKCKSYFFSDNAFGGVNISNDGEDYVTFYTDNIFEIVIGKNEKEIKYDISGMTEIEIRDTIPKVMENIEFL